MRQWQAKQRERLRQHPELIRRREREQIGAGNLPPNGGTAGRTGSPIGPGSDPFEAARVRSGDARTLPEMSEAQLGAAIRPGVLDQRDLNRIRAEGDRRDGQMLLGRIRPNGKLATRLTDFSDDELARFSGHLGDEDMLQVMAEMDRRDVDAALPGIRRDLVGLSEHDLADRARHVADDRDAIGAETHRRRLLADLFPAGRLAADLSAIGDDVLVWGVRYAAPEDAARITAEIDRRYPAPPPAAATGATVADTLANRAALDQAMRPVALDAPPPADPDEWGAYGRDIEKGPDGTEPNAGRTRRSSPSARGRLRTPARRYARCTANTSICSGSPPRTTPAGTCSPSRPRPPVSTPSRCSPGPRTSPTPVPPRT
ncbi:MULTISPECIES: hypothetical protein [unclassified Streptomyces]|uniref:Uncharacterized protein n=1 Tax=Streptomyces sp. NBC_00060 TaxID=2975636 RepID=A0AAU2HD35_9ACTN